VTNDDPPDELKLEPFPTQSQISAPVKNELFPTDNIVDIQMSDIRERYFGSASNTLTTAPSSPTSDSIGLETADLED